jgi:hypothetical protein
MHATTLLARKPGGLFSAQAPRGLGRIGKAKAARQ